MPHKWILTRLANLLWDPLCRRIVRAIMHRKVVRVSAQLSTYVLNKPGEPSRLSICRQRLYLSQNSRVFFYVDLYSRKAFAPVLLRYSKTSRRSRYICNDFQRLGYSTSIGKQFEHFLFIP